MIILKNVDNFFKNRINITGYCVKICFWLILISQQGSLKI